jgi:hypothetical protein
MTVGLLEAMTSAIGEADTEIGGLYKTRLTSALQTGVALAAAYTWDGTLVVTTADTSGVVSGDWIRLDSDGQYFEIDSIIVNTSVTLLNPNNLVIPGTVSDPLSTQSSKAITSLPVETTLDWDDLGIVAVDGIVYHYVSKTATSFDGITHIAGGLSRPGVFKQHRIEAPVVDLNRSRNAIDLTRRSILVDYAEEEYLDALGRNHGVSRTPYLTGNDAVFREVVKALGYNPRGTIYGMELALDALVGAGNYEITEDLISHPCTVFISLIGDAATTLESRGKAFIKDVESQPTTSDTTVDVSITPIAVGSVRWKDEDLVTQTQTQRPSDLELDEYEGDSGRFAWTFNGTNEINQVTLHPVTVDSGCIEFTTAVDNSAAYYQHDARIVSESDSMIEVVATIPSGVTIHATEAHQAAISLCDAYRSIGAGCIQIDANNFGVGLCNPLTGALVAGTTTLAKGAYHTISIHKSGIKDVELRVNGVVVQTATYASFPITFGANSFLFGIFANPPTNNPQFRVRQAAIYSRTITDYWNARGTAGQVAAVNPTRLNDTAFNDFAAGDVDNAVEITGSTASNPQGGNNNGRFVIDSFVSATAVELVGASQKKADITTNKRVVVPLTGYQFQYPDDLGKKIFIDGYSGQVIETLFSQASGNPDLSSGLSPVPEKTNICEVVGTPFTPAVDLDWHLEPVFVNEGPGLDWEMSDAGSFSGTTLTLRQAISITHAAYTILDVLFSDVLSAQVLLDTGVKNLLDAYYPFYIADPLGFIRFYLDAITAAGVIPDFEIV